MPNCTFATDRTCFDVVKKKKKRNFHSELSFLSWIFCIHFFWHEIFGRDCMSCLKLLSMEFKCDPVSPHQDGNCSRENGTFAIVMSRWMHSSLKSEAELVSTTRWSLILTQPGLGSWKTSLWKILIFKVSLMFVVKDTSLCPCLCNHVSGNSCCRLLQGWQRLEKGFLCTLCIILMAFNGESNFIFLIFFKHHSELEK